MGTVSKKSKTVTAEQVRDFRYEVLMAQNDFLRTELMKAYDIIDLVNKEQILLKEAV